MRLNIWYKNSSTWVTSRDESPNNFCFFLNKKISKLGCDKTYCQVSHQKKKKKKMLKLVKDFAEPDIKLFDPVQFYLISLLCSKYFVWCCLRWEPFAYNSSQSTSNFNIFIIHNFKSLFQYQYKASRLWKNFLFSK